jgi:RND superfamily putative drug exporter
VNDILEPNRAERGWLGWIIDRPAWVIGLWIIAALVLWAVAPRWDEVAQDGDLRFLPADSPSQQGQHLLEIGFPEQRSRSEWYLLFCRDREQSLTPHDLAVALDVARHLAHATAVAEVRRTLSPSADRSATSGEIVAKATTQEFSAEGQKDRWNLAIRWYDIAIDLDSKWADAMEVAGKLMATGRLSQAYWDRAAVWELAGDRSQRDRDLLEASRLSGQGSGVPQWNKPLEPEVFSWDGLLEIWTWEDEVLGSKLGRERGDSKLISLRMATEFSSTKQLEVRQGLAGLIERCRARSGGGEDTSGLRIDWSGSGALGADMLLAASQSVRKTEVATMLLVIGALWYLYRSPLLVLIPLVSIALSVWLSTSLIALMAQLEGDPDRWGWLKVFTTSRIFLVVLLYGAGTDFCLFFIARLREELAHAATTDLHGDGTDLFRSGLKKAWLAVRPALVGSAATTVIGLLLMGVARFEKFRFSGWIIGIGLTVSILVVLTFTTSLLAILGDRIFWPHGKPLFGGSAVGRSWRQPENHRIHRWWSTIAGWVVDSPFRCLLSTLAILAVPAIYGWIRMEKVSYNLTNQLSDSSPSLRGMQEIEQRFGVGSRSPIQLVAKLDGMELESADLRRAIDGVREVMYRPGVQSVRCLTDPLGDFPPGRRIGLFGKEAWRKRWLESNPWIQAQFLHRDPSNGSLYARWDVVMAADPFSDEAAEILRGVDQWLGQLRHEPLWRGATLERCGATAGMVDLKQVTGGDRIRIQWAVSIGVGLALWILLGKVRWSLYLMVTVLVSYLVTMGLTHWFFEAWRGDAYQGIDWKVPLFLFVILIAVGQDYNVYLVTRVAEEQRRRGSREGMRHAIETTGSIISSCGMVMAGTFLALAAGGGLQWLAESGVPAWLVGDARSPVLQGMTELGVAISLGILIDTFVVRTILVPALLSLDVRIFDSQTQTRNPTRDAS